MRLFQKKLPKIVNSQRGQVLILVLIFTAVGFLLVPPILSLAFTVNKSANSYQIRTSGVYAADAGVQDGFRQIIQPIPDVEKIPLSTPTAPYPISDLNNKQITIQISKHEDNSPDYIVYKVTSTATGDGSNNIIDAYVKNTLGKIGLGDNAIAVGDSIIFTKNNSGVASIQYPEGNSAAIWSNGDIIAEDGAEILGNVWAAGDIEGGNIQGSIFEGVPQREMIEIDVDPFIQEADAARINDAPDTPPSFFSGGGTFDGSFCVTNSLSITKNTTINGDLFVNGDLNVRANLQINGALYIANNLNIDTGNNSNDLVTTGTIYAGGNLTITQCKAALHNQHDGTIVINGNVKLIKWCLGPDYTLAPELPTIMMYGESFEIESNTEVRAFIYAPNAYIDFTPAASAGLEGAVICKSIKFGNQTFIYRNDILGDAYGGLGEQAHGIPDTFTLEKWHLN